MLAREESVCSTEPKLSTPSSLTTRVRNKLRAIRVMRLVRRAHLYAGLFLMPWLMFFGASGVLFNHPNLGEAVSSQFLPPPRLHALSGFTPWSPAELSKSVVSELNRSQPGRGYDLDETLPARFSGSLIFKAPSADGMHILLLNPERGAAVLAHRQARPEPNAAPFADVQLPLAEYSLPRLNERFENVLARQGLTAKAPLIADPKLAPKLEFRLRDASGTRWNASYDVGTGTLSGRRADTFPSIGVSQLFSTLHTTHHYTFGLGARFFWALFQDLLGVGMLLWGASGLFMWWQLKPTRVVGAVALMAALGIAAVVAVGTSQDVLFGHIKQELAPGEKP